MEFLFSGTLDEVSLLVQRDPDDIEKQYCHVWNHAEFLHLTGIAIPDDVTHFSLEPSNGIIGVKYQFQAAHATWDNTDDMPQFLKDIWAQKEILRNHVKAAVLEARHAWSFFDYIPETNQIVETPHPEKETRMAAQELSRTKIGCRVIMDLVDVLMAKGIITDADLPDYYKDTEGSLKNIIDKIDWSLM